uniref:Uncharacterized protein n=1 Tax=Anopheles culicifacies TaxID=139723 RepID=A0A182MI16_9DIPT
MKGPKCRSLMSMQVSNQNPTGRRTPQVYQGFGGVVAPSVTTTPTATNGSGSTQPNTAGSGSNGRPAKGNNKQSQIPVAIGSSVGTPNMETTVPSQTAGNTDATPGRKQMQSDHVYGMKQQGASMLTVPASSSSAATGTNRTSTNGSQQSAGGNEKMRKNSTGVGAEGGMAGKKTEPSQLPVVGEGTVAKGRGPAANARTLQKQASDEVSAAKGSEQQPKGDKTVVLENSLLAEKSLKGFYTDGEEMDSLLEPWDSDDTQKQPQPQSAGKSKMQKPATQAQEQVSPPKAGGKTQTKPQDTATAEKEVTNSPNKKAQQAAEEGEKNRSPKAAGPKAVESDAPSTPSNVGGAGHDSLIGRPLRSISGRRSTRQIGDIKFTHHRRSAVNDSISSMNVTIGSDIGNDSMLLNTPGSASRKRKEMTPESTSDDGPVVESPKRARLDLSGFFGKIATPVTMLKNRLSRVKLHSTPRALAVDEEDTSKVVTAEATTTTANTSTEKEGTDDGGKPDGMEVDVAKEQVDEASAMSEKKGKEAGQEEGSTVDDEVEVKIVTTDQQQPQKQWCSIM